MLSSVLFLFVETIWRIMYVSQPRYLVSAS